MAVSIKNVCFSYESEGDRVLNNVNLLVERGIIFGLLGPSGCGKTTLLKAMIGILKPTFGEIKIFGFKPGTDECGVPGNVVGFMPQELAVQFDLTIEEMFKYFGIIYGMKREEVITEMKMLLNMLQLPEKNRLLGKMSIGQIRRVSLAITMIHKPQLLILDEPTVGVDPVLTEVIWRLMIDMSLKRGMTIIITTHYIEEIRKATAVAFMRKGEMLEQNYPNRLLEKYNCKKLEDVFLHLCEQQVKAKENARNKRKSSYFVQCAINEERNEKPKFEIEQYLSRLKFQFKLSKFVNTIFATIWKVRIETIRNPLAAFIGLLMVLTNMYTTDIFYGMVPQDIPVAWVVDEKIPFLNLTDCYDENKTTLLSLPEILKSTIDKKTIKLIDYNSVQEAIKDTKIRKLRAIIHLGPNFSASFMDSDLSFSCTDGEVATEIVKAGSINLIMDYSTRVVSDTLRFVMENSVQKFREKIAEILQMNSALMRPFMEFIELKGKKELPIKFDVDNLYGTKNYIIPGIVGANFFVFGFVISFVSNSYNKETDMNLRCFAAGVTSLHTLAGQVIARFLWMFATVILAIFLMIYVMQVPCRGSITIIIILSLMLMLLAIISGSLFSIGISNPHFTLSLLLFVSIAVVVTSGTFWGIENQPYYLKWMSEYSLLTSSLDSLRMLLIRYEQSVIAILPGFLILSWWIVCFYSFAYFILAKQQN